MKVIFSFILFLVAIKCIRAAYFALLGGKAYLYICQLLNNMSI